MCYATVTYQIKVKLVDQSLESLNLEFIYFLFAVFWMLKNISVTQPISRVF